MKILFIINSLGSGGAERVLSILANNLSKKHNITVVLLSNDAIFYELDNNIKIVRADLYKQTNSIIDKLLSNFNRIEKLKNIFQKENPDIIISFTTSVNILSTISAKLSKKKIIISERINYEFLSSKVWRFLRIIIYRFADALVVQSQYDKDKYSFHKKNKVILNPLKIKKIEQNKREKIILAVGRLDLQKGFDRLIESFSLLETDWQLFIAGDGEEKGNLQSLIEKLNLKEKVFLIGRKKDIENYYAKASIFALSSKMEGFPNVLVEAMAYGCAVVAFDCLTGPRDIIEDNKNGFLVKNGDIKMFANKLDTLISDKKNRESFSKEAVKIIKRLDENKIVKEWEELIKEVI